MRFSGGDQLDVIRDELNMLITQNEPTFKPITKRMGSAGQFELSADSHASLCATLGLHPAHCHHLVSTALAGLRTFLKFIFSQRFIERRPRQIEHERGQGQQQATGRDDVPDRRSVPALRGAMRGDLR